MIVIASFTFDATRNRITRSIQIEDHGRIVGYVHARGERSREDISPIIHFLSLFFIFVTRSFEN